MGSIDLINSVPSGYLILANVLSTARIENVVVPEVVQSGTDVTLDCQYYATDDNFLLLWLFNDSRVPVYKWRPHKPPQVAGVLEGHVELSYKAPRERNPREEGYALRITQVEPRLSGNYTCVVVSNGIESRQTKSMLVYSPEHEIDLNIDDQEEGYIKISCNARGVYPQPDLIIECNNKPIFKQYERVWLEEDLYNAESKAQLVISEVKEIPIEIKCRLRIPLVDYTAIKKRYMRFDNEYNNNCAWNRKPPVLFILTATTTFSYYLR